MSTSNQRLAAVAAGAAILVGFGSFGAVASALITSEDIQNHEVKSADIARDAVGSGKIEDGSIKMRDLDPATVTELQGARTAQDAPQGAKGEKGDAGSQGPQGLKGDKGDDGDNGQNGVSGYEVRSWDYSVVSGGGWADMGCTKDSGKVPLGGGYWWKDEAVAMEKGLSVVVSMPGRMDWDGSVTGTKDTPNPAGAGWIIRPNKPANVNPGALTVYVICASMAGSTD